MKDNQQSELTGQVKKKSEEIHQALNSSDLNRVLKIIGHINTKQEMDALEQFFLVRYNYNYKTKFFQKGDFGQCMKLSDVLNKRIYIDGQQ